MSVSQLDSAFQTALSKATVPIQRKAANPYATMGGMYQDSGYGQEYQEDQYDHYRGQFYSAARLIPSRLASQPVLVGVRKTVRNQQSADYMLENGMIPPNGCPAWLGDPRTIQVSSNNPLAQALANPNKYHTPMNFWEMIGASLMTTGRGFIVAMEGKDRPYDLLPIPATWMKPVGKESPFDAWAIKPPGMDSPSIYLSYERVAHFYFADPSNPTSCISPLTAVAKSVLSSEAIQNAQYSEFMNEGIPKVALIAGDIMNETGFTDDANRTSSARPVRLEPEQRRQIITWFQQQYAGTKKRGLPIVLDALIRDIKILSRSPDEMGYMDSSNLTKEQIHSGIGVSEILTGNLSGVTRASGSLADQFFMDYCFNPIVTMVSQAMTKRLGPLFSTRGEEILAWIAPGVHKDTELDIEYLRIGVRAYALLRNEVRKILATRFGGIPRLEGFDDVIIPEKLEERLPDEDYQGVGRLALTMGAGDDD